MKYLLILTAYILLSVLIIFTSCKKERSCETCLDINKPPIANAGVDQTISLPVDSILLNASNSSDPDGTITSYKWVKIAGHVSSSIIKPDSSKAIVKGLTVGVYQFALTVTDNGGLSARDTVQVIAANVCDTNRPHINAQLIPIGTLSQVRVGIAMASAGNKILFGGGLTPANSNSSRVDIYDLATQTWSTAELSQARYDITAIGAGNKIFFAGGEIGYAVSTVDIYDVTANQWYTSSLSRAGSEMAPAVVGTKVLFSGGYEGSGGLWSRTTTVDIYDLATNNWSSASLSTVRRGSHAAATVGSKVYVSGGESWPANPVPGTWFASNTIDVYDDATNSWSTALLSEGKYGHAGIGVQDRIFWAGGKTGAFPNIAGSCSVDIMNVTTGNISIQNLSRPGVRSAVIKNNQFVFFAGDNQFDIYNLTTDKWSIGVLPAGFTGGPIISVNNTIYVVSGIQVYKLAF